MTTVTDIIKNLWTKISLPLAIIVFVVIIASVLGYAYYLGEINRQIVIPGKDKLILTISKGMGVSEVGLYLKGNGLIKYPEILKIYMYLNKDKIIQAGYYEIPTKDLSLVKLVDIFKNGSFERKLTFLEGWRVQEYVDYLKKEIGDEFADKFLNSKFIKEGYIFPDTYIIEDGYDPENLASWMRNTFDEKFSNELVGKAELRGLTQDQVIILASIVEREMNIKKDRPIVAGILIKRLKNNWALQADATVQYAKGSSGNWWPKISKEDLRIVNSPYNTYAQKGLPPGPISNPGLNAIESVIGYEETPYWFYITGHDGVTRYAETLEKHNENVRRFL